MLRELINILPQAWIDPIVSVDEMFQAGGPFVRWIFLTALVMWVLIVERYWFFAFIYPQRVRALKAEWQTRASRQTWTARRIRDAMISEMNVAMKAGLPVMRVVIPICPLLGLLGTVGGMLEVFDIMAIKGAVDARAMAYGVSHAMICTLSGLGVAISGMFFVHRFHSRVRVETELLADALTYE